MKFKRGDLVYLLGPGPDDYDPDGFAGQIGTISHLESERDVYFRFPDMGSMRGPVWCVHVGGKEVLSQERLLRLIPGLPVTEDEHN